ncbi:MAG: hypothetical protein AB7N80_04510 [Bdellovibrionales bacterium]
MLAWFFTYLVSVSTAAQDKPKKIAVYFGGGGETQDQENQFDRSFELFLLFAKSRNWNGDFYYSNQHKASQAIAKTHLKKEVPDFSDNNYNDKISQLLRDIQSGKIKAQDQLLLQIDSHGTIQEGVYEVVGTDNTIMVTPTLRDLRNAAEKAGVKLAIVSTTCYSGQLQELATGKTCVVSMARPERPAYTNDGEWLNEQLKNSSNLEEAFLKSRASKIFPAQPMISSGPGQLASETLANMRTVLRQWDNAKDSLYNSGTLFEEDDRSKACTYALAAVQQQASRLALAGSVSWHRVPINKHFSGFRRYDVLRSLLLELDEEKNNWEALKYLETACQQKPSASDCKQPLLGIKKIERAQSELRIQKILEYLNGIEREMFDALYKKFAETDKSPNPCRDFKL